MFRADPSEAMNATCDAVIIGGGLAGIVATRRLCVAGLRCQLLEASSQLGGRIRTDQVEGFLLDRGFQVFLTAYPEARAALDYERLQLCRFEPGALIRYGGRFSHFVDPWRKPSRLLSTALSPVATWSDKWRVREFRRDTTRGELAQINQRPERKTIDLLRKRGFSEVIIERFFRPFLGGVFLDRDLATSSRMCEFVFRMFASGDAAVPAKGMQEIPRQLAEDLPADVVRLDCPVASLERQEVILASGERLQPRVVIIATDAPSARKLLHDTYPASGRSVRCCYFDADEPPVKEPILVLNGDGEGPINNLCVPSQVSRRYAPDGRSLVSVTMVGRDAAFDQSMEAVRSQLRSWFGRKVDRWRHLRTYDIPYALPDLGSPALEPVAKVPQISEGVFICGDHCDTASINGAMASGRRAAEAVLQAWNGQLSRS